MVLTAIKVTVVVPDYLFQEINWLFAVFIANSGTTYWLSHVLHMRGVMSRQASRCEARSFVALLIVRLSITFIIVFVGPIFDNLMRDETQRSYYFWLKCESNNPYPLRFLLIFFMDFFWATTDLMIFIFSPKTYSSKKRLKEMRIADIETSVT
mmetsp:Transcript_9097/g.12371  ORF Transcript_9097/g.12371 Transcript_9097/m.12371 type:complete len:153 (-) Transcript_9097:1477-1935(-)